jgi:hypothetical protein
VFYVDAQGRLQLQWMPPPEQDDIEALAEAVRRRVLRACDLQLCEPEAEQLALATAQARAIDLLPDGPQPQPQQRRPSPLCASTAGFSLHAGVAVGCGDRGKLEDSQR